MIGCGQLCLSMSASGGGHSLVARRPQRVQQHAGQWSDVNQAAKHLRQWQRCFSSPPAAQTESCELAALEMNLFAQEYGGGGQYTQLMGRS